MVRREFILSRRLALSATAAALAAPALISRLVAPAVARATLRGPSEPLFRRFRLGDFEITALADTSAMVDGPWPIVGEDRPKEEVEALMRDNLLQPSRFRPGFSPLLVNTGRNLVLIDAGNGEHGFVPRPVGGRLAAALSASGVTPDEVDIVAFTHCHVDHIGGVVEAGKAQFPNASYVLGAIEDAFWRDDARLAAPPESTEFKSASLFSKALLPLAANTRRINPGDEVVAGVTALATYGHTPGHLAFHIESAGKRLLVWGDCAHHETASLAHPEWSAFFDMDKELGKATRARIYDMAATERLPVLGYHTSFPSLGFVTRSGTGFRWIPETYQFAE